MKEIKLKYLQYSIYFSHKKAELPRKAKNKMIIFFRRHNYICFHFSLKKKKNHIEWFCGH